MRFDGLKMAENAQESESELYAVAAEVAKGTAQTIAKVMKK
jgi:hypothetical protein